MKWRYVTPGSEVVEDIAFGDEPNIKRKYSTSEMFDFLIVDSVTAIYAGRYICTDEAGLGESCQSELIVLGKFLLIASCC